MKFLIMKGEVNGAVLFLDVGSAWPNQDQISSIIFIFNMYENNSFFFVFIQKKSI
jgi:hypothetical protein